VVLAGNEARRLRDFEVMLKFLVILQQKGMACSNVAVVTQLHLRLRSKVLLWGVIGVQIHILSRHILEATLLFIPVRLIQLVFNCGWLLMRHKTVFLLLWFNLELNVLFLHQINVFHVQQILIRIYYHLILLFLIHEIDLLHLVELGAEVLFHCASGLVVIHLVIGQPSGCWALVVAVALVFFYFLLELRVVADLVQQIQLIKPFLVELLQIWNDCLPLGLHIRADWLTLAIIGEVGKIWLAWDVSDQHPLLMLLLSHLQLWLLLLVHIHQVIIFMLIVLLSRLLLFIDKVHRLCLLNIGILVLRAIWGDVI
jgi:hypothetical protein